MSELSSCASFNRITPRIVAATLNCTSPSGRAWVLNNGFLMCFPAAVYGKHITSGFSQHSWVRPSPAQTRLVVEVSVTCFKVRWTQSVAAIQNLYQVGRLYLELNVNHSKNKSRLIWKATDRRVTCSRFGSISNLKLLTYSRWRPLIGSCYVIGEPMAQAVRFLKCQDLIANDRCNRVDFIDHANKRNLLKSYWWMVWANTGLAEIASTEAKAGYTLPIYVFFCVFVEKAQFDSKLRYPIRKAAESFYSPRGPLRSLEPSLASLRVDWISPSSWEWTCSSGL